MNFAAAAAGNHQSAPIGPAGEKSEHERSDVRLWHDPVSTPVFRSDRQRIVNGIR
jgi:hypothetical protein